MTPPTTTAPPRAPRAGLRGPLVLAALVAGLLLVTPVMSYGWSDHGIDIVISPVARGLVVAAGLAVVGAVVLAARWPTVATLVVAATFVTVPLGGWFVWGWFAGMVGVLLVAASGGRRRALLPYALAVGVAAVYCGTDVVAYLPVGAVTSGTGEGFQLLVFVLYALWVTGLAVAALAVGASGRARARERHARQQEVRAQQQEDRALTTDALARERARMARDLHDVVAHHVSLIAVRAESAPYQYPDLDDDARAVLADVARDAREALGELREALNVLRRTDDDAAPGARRPQPTAHDVDGLVADARAAGQQVRVTGAWAHVPDAAGYVLFRALQEALTNARRHAPGAVVDVELVQRDGEVGLRVSQPLTGPAAPAVRAGRGLIGMRERVDALGGTLRTDATASRFVVDVRLPVGAAS